MRTTRVTDGKKSERIRWGLLSTARINEAVIGSIRVSRRSELVAVASRKIEKAEEYAKERGIPHAFGSYEGLLKSEDVDVIYVSVPNALHHEWVIKALEAGKHVLCEKPIVTKLSDLDEIQRKSEKLGLVVFEGFMYLHHVQTRKLKEFIHQGRIGKIRLVDSWFSFLLSSEKGKDIRLNPDLDGGSLWDVGVYPNSLSIFLAENGSPTEVYATKVMGETGVDLFVAGQMRFRNGTVSQISASIHSPFDVGARIIGDEGSIFVEEPWKPGVGGSESHITISRSNSEKETVKFPAVNPYLAEIEAMEACVLDNVEPMVPLNLSRDFLRSVTALNKSAQTEHSVKT